MLRTRAPACCLAMLLVLLARGVVGAEAEKPRPADTGAAGAGAKVDEARPADKLGIEQQGIADNFRHLQDLLLRMAELSELADPRRAALLKKAVRESEERLIGVQFESLVELLEKDRLSRAIENQDNLREDLEALLELLLSENRPMRVESEKARIREYLKRLNQIIKQQKDVQGRTAGTGRPGPLADQQQKLADKTGDLAQDIQQNEEPAAGPPKDAARGSAEDEHPKPDGTKRQEGRERAESGKKSGKAEGQDEGQDKGQAEPQGQAEGQSQQGAEDSGKSEDSPSERAQGGQQQDSQEGQGQGQRPSQEQEQNPARRRIQAAESRMREAEEKLKEAEREGAVEKQEEAIRELEQAKADLERILRQLREEEMERMLTLLEARFQKMLQMQRAVYEGTQRLDKVPEPERTHNQEIEASRLGRKEAEIVVEADKALTLLRDDGTAVALPEALEQVREDMRQVVRRLDRAEVGPLTQSIEEEIIAALEEMIEAVGRAQQDADERKSRPMPPGAPQDQPLVDSLAEIKMIRAMQMRVNRRTERYSKLVEGEQAESPDLLEALDRLAERQARIHQITRDLEMGKDR